MKSWTTPTAEASTPTQEGDKVPLTVPDAPPLPLSETEGHDQQLQDSEEDDDEVELGEEKRKPLWGPTECCISCVSLPSLLNTRKEKES